jgi:hypothetical protein
LAQAGDGFAAVAAGADDFRPLIGDGLAVSPPEGIGIADGPADDGTALGGALIGPDEDFLQDAEVVELVDGEKLATNWLNGENLSLIRTRPSEKITQTSPRCNPRP